MIRSNRSVNGEELHWLTTCGTMNFWRERVKLSALMLELRMEMEQLTADIAVLEAEHQEWEDSVHAYEGQGPCGLRASKTQSDVRVTMWYPMRDGLRIRC